jgi:hypothetical protein
MPRVSGERHANAEQEERTRRQAETERKLKKAQDELAVEVLALARPGRWGKVTVELVVQDGYAKHLEVTRKATYADQ